MSMEAIEAQSRYEKWLESLRTSDSKLYEELKNRLSQRVKTPASMKSNVTGVTLETAARGEDLTAMTYETIVREGRPALLVRANKIAFDSGAADTSAKVMIDRLKDAAATLEPLIPLVGRIDVGNYPGNLPYAGTGWLVDKNLVVTNRHVAELISRSNDGQFVFRPGRFGEALTVSVDYLHESDSKRTDVVKVLRVLWIERDPKKADIAFLQVDSRTTATRRPFFKLAKKDAAANSEVAVIGYPARAPAHIIPDQAWMDQIYGSAYDIKRIAPGLAGADSKGWATHDCTTLGGNSGSVVVDMKSGDAVALHFAGLYLIENYAVPASTIRRYLRTQPWTSSASIRNDAPDDGQGSGRGVSAVTAAVGSTTSNITVAPGTSVSFTIPLTITITVGSPQTATGASAPAGQGNPISSMPAPGSDAVEQVAQRLLRNHAGAGVYSAWAGFQIRDGSLSESPCLVVSVDPQKLQEIKTRLPSHFENLPVDVWPASVEEQLGLIQTEAAATSIQYNDDDRTGDEFSFDWVKEEMTARFHVGPERSWVELRKFLEGAQPAKTLVSSMYQFHASHVAEAVEKQLTQNAEMSLVVANQTHDPSSGKTHKGDFNRSETFGKWDQNFKDSFERVYVPLGPNGLVANAYHIKVTVRDGKKVWLSSGNWTRTSQPLILDTDLNNPKKTNSAGNREWHVVLTNKTLAERFSNHIKADYEQSLALGGTPEAVADEELVDVPLAVLEAIELEAAPSQVVEPLEVKRVLRIKPLLTPDKKGAVYSKAVLELIRSARKQLLFQNQYIKMSGAKGGFLKELVEALAERAQKIKDFRIILRSGDAEMRFNLTQLKKLGVDIDSQVKILADTHTKGIVVDGKRVLLGSHNWSSSGVTLNRDASLIVDDAEVAKYFRDVFELDWSRSQPPKFTAADDEQVRPAMGEEAPAGYTRMTLSEYLER